jgi:hypothetical protein
LALFSANPALNAVTLLTIPAMLAVIVSACGS